MSIWKQNPDLMDRLSKAQNHPKNCRIDIMTFAGMCDSRDELERHVLRYEERADGIRNVSPNPRVPIYRDTISDDFLQSVRNDIR